MTCGLLYSLFDPFSPNLFTAISDPIAGSSYIAQQLHIFEGEGFPPAQVKPHHAKLQHPSTAESVCSSMNVFAALNVFAECVCLNVCCRS